MREAGATARADADHGGRAAVERPGRRVLTEPARRGPQADRAASSAYGALAAAAAKLPVPKKEELQFKPKTAWRYIGKGHAIYDLPGHRHRQGAVRHGARMRRHGVRLDRAPAGARRQGEVIRRQSRAEGKGVTPDRSPSTRSSRRQHFQPLGGVAVIADNTWAAFQGRKELKVNGTTARTRATTPTQFKKELQETARKPAKVVRNVGDVDAEFAKGGKIIEADYYARMLAHAAMEPPVAVADSATAR